MKGTILSSSQYGPWSTDRKFVLVRAWLNPWLSHGFCSIKLPRVFVVPHAEIPVQQRIAQQYFTWENDSYKAQNNFWMVARHNDQPKKFFLSQVLFLTGQNTAKSYSWHCHPVNSELSYAYLVQVIARSFKKCLNGQNGLIKTWPKIAPGLSSD